MAVVIRVDQNFERNLRMAKKGFRNALGSAAAGKQYDVDLRPRRLFFGRAAQIRGTGSISVHPGHWPLRKNASNAAASWEEFMPTVSSTRMRRGVRTTPCRAAKGITGRKLNSPVP